MTVAKWSVIKLAGAVALGAAALASGPALVAQDKSYSKEEAEGIIFERQQIMEALEEKAEILGNIAAGLDRESSMPVITKEIAALAKESRTSFEANVPGGRAKPEIWTTDAAEFKARMDNWVAAADNMAKIAETETKEAVTSVMGDALPCKQCHDVYRTPPKPKA